MIADLKETQNQHSHVPSNKGRQMTSVSFGGTKNLNVAKIILESIMSHDSMAHITEYFVKTNLNNYKAMTEAFQKLIKKLEEIHA